MSLAAAFLATAACHQQAVNSPDNDAAVAPVAPAAPAAPIPSGNAIAPTRPDPSVPPPPHVAPDAPPLPGEKTALGAARRLQEYCDAVATRRYGDAYAYWGGDGQASGLTLAQFRDSFAKYGAYDCHIGTPGESDGAAGSIYIEIPLQVTGVLTKGGGFRLEGPVTMKRVNDVDGATPAQLRWHIVSSGLKPRP